MQQPITATDRSQLSAKQTNSIILEAAHAMQQVVEYLMMCMTFLFELMQTYIITRQ